MNRSLKYQVLYYHYSIVSFTSNPSTHFLSIGLSLSALTLSLPSVLHSSPYIHALSAPLLSLLISSVMMIMMIAKPLSHGLPSAQNISTCKIFHPSKLNSLNTDLTPLWVFWALFLWWHTFQDHYPFSKNYHLPVPTQFNFYCIVSANVSLAHIIPLLLNCKCLWLRFISIVGHLGSSVG